MDTTTARQWRAARLRATSTVALGLVVGGLLAGGCSSPTATAPAAATTAPAAGVTSPAASTAASGDRALDADDQAILDSLPACPAAPPVADPALVWPDHVLVPPGTVLVSRVDTNPLIELEAWTPTDPIRVRRFYQRGVLGSLKPIQIEDEVVEAEALMEWPGGRFFVKAVALCPTESTLHLVVSQSGSADADVPTPANTDPARG